MALSCLTIVFSSCPNPVLMRCQSLAISTPQTPCNLVAYALTSGRNKARPERAKTALKVRL